MNYRALKLTILITTIPVLWSGCGDNGDDSRSFRDVQDVRRIPYQLTSATLVGTLVKTTPEGEKVETITKEIRYGNEGGKDNVIRVIDNENFVLVVNDVTSKIRILSDGTFNNVQNFDDVSTQGCRVAGNSTMSGSAANLQLSLVWDVNISIDGPACNDQSRQKFLDFQNAAVSTLNFKSVLDLLNAADTDRDQLSRMHLHVRLNGEGT